MFFFRTRRFLVACKTRYVMAEASEVTSGDAQQCQAEGFVPPLPFTRPSGARRRRGFSPELPRATRSQANHEDSAFFPAFSSCGTARKNNVRRRCDVVFKIRRFARVAGKILILDKKKWAPQCFTRRQKLPSLIVALWRQLGAKVLSPPRAQSINTPPSVALLACSECTCFRYGRVYLVRSMHLCAGAD